MKLAQPKEKVAATGIACVEDFSPGMVKTIVALEVLGALGMLLPAALGIIPVLVPIAAVGLAALMIGAAITHARRKERQMLPVNLILFALAVVVAVARFGPQSFTA